ncbi:hypothetical protein DMH27_01445 [Raoultella planticola]|nr:hypothetical protein [Raoultella planticola]
MLLIIATSEKIAAFKPGRPLLQEDILNFFAARAVAIAPAMRSWRAGTAFCRCRFENRFQDARKHPAFSCLNAVEINTISAVFYHPHSRPYWTYRVG